MKDSYKKLWNLLIDKNLDRSAHCDRHFDVYACEDGKGEDVEASSRTWIYAVLQCDIGDIVGISNKVT